MLTYKKMKSFVNMVLYKLNLYMYQCFNVHFFQKPLRTWEIIEDHRRSIKEHAFKVKRQLRFYYLFFCPE